MHSNEDRKAYRTKKSTAYFCDVSVKTLDRWLKAGLPSFQATPGGRVLIRVTDLDAFLNAKRVIRTTPLDSLVEETLREITL